MRRAVRSLIYLVAAGLALFGAMAVGFQYVNHRLRHAEISLWYCFGGGALFVLGLILFGLGGKLAKQLTEDFEDDENQNIKH